MQFKSNYPTYSGGAATLRGLDDPNLTQYTFDGVKYAVDSAGNTWREDSRGVMIPDDTFTATFRQVEANAPGAVQEAVANSWSMSGVLDNLSQIVSTVVQAKAQHDLLQANIDRASKGLPPLNAQAYMPGVNVGVSSDTKVMLYTVAGGIGALLLFNTLMSRRRR